MSGRAVDASSIADTTRSRAEMKRTGAHIEGNANEALIWAVGPVGTRALSLTDG